MVPYHGAATCCQQPGHNRDCIVVDMVCTCNSLRVQMETLTVHGNIVSLLYALITQQPQYMSQVALLVPAQPTEHAGCPQS